MTVGYLSKLDAVYRSYLLSDYFIKGWGDPRNIKKICNFRKVVSDRAKCTGLVADDYSIEIDKDEDKGYYRLLEGRFTSPLVQHLPDVVPEECQQAYVQILIPTKWKHSRLKPMCVQLAGTGDHGFWRRRNLIAKPLIKEYGIGSILLENPYYGLRKPKVQIRSILHNVSDVFVMGGCLMLESIALLKWCQKNGYGPLSLTGISMGGHMASLAGGSYDKPVGIAPCLSWTTASCAFTQGVMSGAIPWELLQAQYKEEPLIREELSKMVKTRNAREGHSFEAGQDFARKVSDEIDSYNQRQKSERGGKVEQPNASYNSSMARLIESLPIQFLQLSNHKTKEGAVEAWNFMRGIMDECTALGNYGRPVDPSLAICVAATRDAYVPREGTEDIRDVWPGCEVRYIDCGHVTGFLFSQNYFRKAISDSLDRVARKYYSEALFGGDAV